MVSCMAFKPGGPEGFQVQRASRLEGPPGSKGLQTGVRASRARQRAPGPKGLRGEGEGKGE